MDLPLFDGKMVEMIINIDPKYEEYVFTTTKGRRILMGEMNKAVYGNVLSGILFYEKLVTYLASEVLNQTVMMLVHGIR